MSACAAYRLPDGLRETDSDTIMNNPSGEIFGAVRPQRKPSPTKLKVIHLGDAYCLLAVAPRRNHQGHGGVRGTNLQEAEHLLHNVKLAWSRWSSLGAWKHLLP